MRGGGELKVGPGRRIVHRELDLEGCVAQITGPIHPCL